MPSDRNPRSRPSKTRLRYLASSRNITVSGGHFEVSAYRFEGAAQGGSLSRVDPHPDGQDVEISMFEDMVGGHITSGTFIAAGTTVNYRTDTPATTQHTGAAVATPRMSGQAAGTIEPPRRMDMAAPANRTLPAPPSQPLGVYTLPYGTEAPFNTTAFPQARQYSQEWNVARDGVEGPQRANAAAHAGRMMLPAPPTQLGPTTHPSGMHGPFNTAPPLQPHYPGSQQVPWQVYYNYQNVINFNPNDPNAYPHGPVYRF